MKVYEKLAQTGAAFGHCNVAGNDEWALKHYRELQDLKKQLPSGSGIDGSTNFEKFANNKIVISSSFHVMDENGFYDRWVDFVVTVRPAFIGSIDVTITGKFGKDQDIKEYLQTLYYDALTVQYKQQ